MARGGADALALRPESERQRGGAQQTYIILPVADRDYILQREPGVSDQMAQDIQFAKPVLIAALRMKGHRLGERHFSGRFIVAESHHVRDAEVRKDPARRRRLEVNSEGLIPSYANVVVPHQSAL
jgi:hypothetical protein